MADFFFFTDVDLLNSQTAAQAYGPAGVVSSTERFRVTSLHSATGSPKAYAICDGIVCVQQDENPLLVNLILKPAKQPDLNLPFIKFFVYKGILKSSLFDGNLNIKDNVDNDLLNSINTSWDSYILSSTIPPNLPSTDPPSGKSLGIDLLAIANYMDNDPIDNLFYKNNLEYQFPSVIGGWVIGEFNSAAFGLEILTEKIDYTPKLNLTRKMENRIEVQELSPSFSNIEVFRHWHDKEEILNYVDPCAFFGSFYGDKIRAKSSTGDFEKFKKNEVYNNILKGIQHISGPAGNFYNKNRIYLDIRNDYNQSYNYSKEYGAEIQVAFDDVSELTSTPYCTDNWPIMMISNSMFPVDNTSNKNEIHIKLPLGQNQNPLLYISFGYRLFELNTFRTLKNKKQFLDLDYVPSELFTNKVSLVVPNNTDILGTTVISSLVLLRYFKRIDWEDSNPLPSSGTVVNRLNSLDNLFVPFQMNIPFLDMMNVNYKTYEEEVFIEKSFGSAQFIAKSGVAKDNYNITLFAFAKNSKRRLNIKAGKSIALSTGQTNNYDHFLSFLDTEIFKNQLSTGEIALGLDTIDYLTFSKGDFDWGSSNKFLSANAEDLIILTIDRVTYETTLPNLVNTNNLLTDYKIFIGARQLEREIDDNESEYISFELLLRGFIDISGNVEIIEIPTNIKMYSHDLI